MQILVLGDASISVKTDYLIPQDTNKTKKYVQYQNYLNIQIS